MDESALQDDGAIEAVILDMDGVLTDTADAHFAAWKAVFDEMLHAREGGVPFSRDDYLQHVDGLPRHEGIRRFLGSRGIELPAGEPVDSGTDTVRGIGNTKNERFNAWLGENSVPVFEDARAMIDGLRAGGLKVGVFSASRNAKRVLESAGVRDLLDACVDGTDAAELGLDPKPAPDQLLETARRIGAAAGATLVVEDAVAGVKAGAAGRFGLVVGIDRQEEAHSHRHALRVNGADLVTRDLRRLLLPDGRGLKTLDRLPLFRDRADEIGTRLSSRRPAVFLDFDGTLSPIVDDYRDAAIPEATRRAVARLADLVPVAIISGRDLADLRARVGLDTVMFAGSHGFDIAGPGGLAERPEAARGFAGILDSAETELRDAVSGIEGARIERKVFAIAVHFREAGPDDTARIEEAATRVAARHERLRSGRGKKVVEIQPRADWDKGRAVQWLLAGTGMGKGRPLPVYVGDDLTDEDAFSALSNDGLLVAVRGGGRATLADYALTDPDDVRGFLDWLAAQVQGTT